MIAAAFENLLVAVACVLVVPVGAVLLLLVHEIAHAVVGHLCGFAVVEMQFGTGPAWWARWFGSMRVTFSSWPSHGYVVGCFRGVRWLRTRIALFALAGPMANLAVFALAFSWYQVAESPWLPLARLGMAYTGLAAAVAFVPKTLRTGGQSDLQVVLAAARLGPEAAAGLIAHNAGFAAHHACMRAFELGQLDAAEAVLATHRGDPAHRGWTGAMAALLAVARGMPARALAELDDIERDERAAEAREAVPEPLARTKDRRLAREINRAFVLVAIGTDEAAAAALLLVAAWPAGRHARGETAVAARRTRGLVLLRCGRIAEAIVELQKAVRGHEPHWLRALGMAYLAEAFVRTRHFDAAARWARKARRLDPTGPLLPLFLRPVEAALAERRAPAPPIR